MNNVRSYSPYIVVRISDPELYDFMIRYKMLLNPAYNKYMTKVLFVKIDEVDGAKDVDYTIGEIWGSKKVWGCIADALDAIQMDFPKDNGVIIHTPVQYAEALVSQDGPYDDPFLDPKTIRKNFTSFMDNMLKACKLMYGANYTVNLDDHPVLRWEMFRTETL